MAPRSGILSVLALLLAGGAAYLGWQYRPEALPAGIAMANGRIEATQIDIATKLPGRIKEVLVKEGDFVDRGQVAARMDATALEAELRQAQAQLAQAKSAIATANAVVAQRESELTLARNTLRRSQDLVQRNYISAQKLDSDSAQMLSAEAALAAARSKVVEAQFSLQAANAAATRIGTDLDDSVLKVPRAGRIQYRLAEPGEVLGAGGKVLNMLDLAEVYMTVFLPEGNAGRVAIGAEARLVLDAAPQYVIPAKVTFVAAEAQFTPKAVETQAEREKLVFRVKAQIAPKLLQNYLTRVKTGLPGVAYVGIDAHAAWPEKLQVKLPPQ
jgi:HlyD family secretion protein